METVLLLIAAALLGSMVFFPVVIAPLVFKTLPAQQAGTFLRSMFPRYYAWGAVLSGVALLVAVASAAATDYVLLGGVVVGFIVSRQVLMPRINAARDRGQTGDAASMKRFKLLHGVSVVINLLQIAMLVGLLGRHAI